ncbi:MAG: hypothetical protein ACLGSA_12730 [Acidobacteriota bacterium]
MDDARIAEIRGRLEASGPVAPEQPLDLKAVNEFHRHAPADIQWLLDHYTAAELWDDETRMQIAADTAGIVYVGCDTPDALAEEVLTLRAKLDEAERERDALLGSVHNLDAEVLSALEGLGVNLNEDTKGPSLITPLAVAISAFLGVNKDIMADLATANERNKALEALEIADLRDKLGGSERVVAGFKVLIDAANERNRLLVEALEAIDSRDSFGPEPGHETHCGPYAKIARAALAAAKEAGDAS